MKLTPSQKRAVAYTGGNLQLIACAGSGKTEVVSRRVVHLLTPKKGRHLLPGNIVAFTFTDKAAAELKDRILTRCQQQFGEIHGLAEMYVGTIHGYCLQLLQTHLFEFLKYSVLNEVQARLLVSRNSKKSGLTFIEIINGPSAGQNLKRNPQDVKIFIDAMNVIREDNVSFKSLPAGIHNAYQSYRDLLDQHRYMDYSRILAEAVAALYDTSNPNRVNVQRSLASTVKYLIVDEYQDVNPIQEKLIRRLHELGATVCVVGDDDQTIYQWRGSEIDNILTFKAEYAPVKNITLPDNFRSSAGVVDTARSVVQANSSRLPKSMLASGHQRFERGDILAVTFSDPEAEAKWIADRVLALRGVPFCDEPDSQPRGLSWADCAVLLRSVSSNGDPIIAAFKAHGIPYVIGGLSNLFEAPEVQASVALFRYMVRAIDKSELKLCWLHADLGLSPKALDTGVAVLDTARSWQAGERWGAYNIQRAFLQFLEAVQLREENIPKTKAGADRGEIVYYNFGKFSQVISDFEQIYFQSDPQEKYNSFVWWLENEAPAYYEEGGEDVGFAQPDAVQIMTIHQAKGMEWPAVFVPALQRNRFPSTAGGKGRSKWHILPRTVVKDSTRYDGSVEDERRLFYVALTRSKKFLSCTFAPTPGNKLYQRESQFFGELIKSPHVLTRPLPVKGSGKLRSKPKRETPKIVLSFSELKYFFECPRQFKLRFVYGFNPPLHEALGLGKSLHDALAEIHKRAMSGEVVTETESEVLVDRHLHVPFAYPTLKQNLRDSAIASVKRYLHHHSTSLKQTKYSEQQVEIQVGDGITVNGRIDLIKRIDTGEVAVVDFKSSARAQAEDVTRAQLHTYAMGYHQLTGQNADLVEILNLDEQGKSVREVVDDSVLTNTKAKIEQAGTAIRENKLPKIATWCSACEQCDLVGICRDRKLEKKRAKAGA